MKKSIGIFILLCSFLYANSNIDNRHGSIVNYGTMNNELNNYESEKVEFDSRIKQLASQIANEHKNKGKHSVILDIAGQTNKFNIPKKEKKEKCIKHALSVKFIKIGASFARTECTKIFN